MANQTPSRSIESPRDIESEQWVLGACITIPDLIDDCTVLLRPSDFFVEANGIIFRVLQEMHAAAKTIDHVTLSKRLMKDQALLVTSGEKGIMPLLIELVQAAPVPAHARIHAQRVREESVKRGIISACMASAVESRESDEDANELLARAEGRLQTVQDDRLTDSVCHVGEAVTAFMADLEARLDGSKAPAGVATCFPDLDELIGTMRPGEVVVLAARPSMGKSALAINIATNAVCCGIPTLLISLEMSRLELADRMLSSRTSVELRRMQRGTIDKDERRRLIADAAEISQVPLLIDDTPSRSIMDVCATARRLKRKNKLGLVVIDYLQLIEPEDRKAVREQQVASISRKLKALARLLKIPVLVLAQLNRLMENRPNKRPRLSDLRESGSIEQDADVVLFVHREEYYLQPKEVEERRLEGVAEIIVAKQRNGPTGTVALLWQKDFTRFVNAAQGTLWDPDQPYVQDPF